MAKLVKPVQSGQKRKMTAWQALIWAYADENIRAVGGHLSLTNNYSLSSWPAERGDPLHSATVRGYLQAHEDAVAIDAIMRTAIRNDAQYLLVVKAAEDRKPVRESVVLPERIPLPVLHNTGAQFPKPKVEIHPISRKGWFCPIEWTGYPPDEAERMQQLQRRRYELFLAAVSYFDGLEFTARRIEGIGLAPPRRVLTACDESLTQENIIREVREEAR